MSLLAGVCALLIAAPFEARRPLLALPGQSLSTVETVLLFVLGAAAIASAAKRGVVRWQTALTLPWVAFIAAMGVAATLAPAHTANALNMTARLALALGVYLVVLNGAASVSRVHIVFIAAAASGAIVAALAVLEYFGAGVVVRALALFRAADAHVGGQARAAGPFQYPTIASMFLELAFAFAVALTLTAIDRGRTRYAAAGFAVAALIAQAIVFTMTRAGLVSVAATIVFFVWVRYRRTGFDRGVRVLAAIGIVVVAQVVSSRPLEFLRLRLTTETMDAWFRADVDGPRELAMTTGGRIDVPVRLTNTGGATWDSAGTPRIRLSYHWLLAEEDAVVAWEGLRTDFPRPVPPGASVAIDAAVLAPPVPGEYRLMWDLEQEHRLWFSTEPGGGPLHVSRARVDGPARAAVDIVPTPLPRPIVRPGRLVLWRAAAEMFAARPLTGLGPDNYRLSYGRYAGLASFDPRVHSNNMFLEVLVGGGILGAAAFAWFCGAAARQTAAAIRASRDPLAATLAAGVMAATLAIGLHGLVDSFISFTGTYILMATTLGLGAALAAAGHGHAHCV